MTKDKNLVIKELKLELSELKEKLDKLSSFLSNPENHKQVGTVQYKLLVDQEFHMKKYKQILTKRIEDLCFECTECFECETVHLVLG